MVFDQAPSDGYAVPRCDDTAARYMDQYARLYDKWQKESTALRSAVEGPLRVLADEHHTPCCGIRFFYDGCSSVWCNACNTHFCGVCHQMFHLCVDCHDHVYRSVGVPETPDRMGDGDDNTTTADGHVVVCRTPDLPAWNPMMHAYPQRSTSK